MPRSWMERFRVAGLGALVLFWFIGIAAAQVNLLVGTIISIVIAGGALAWLAHFLYTERALQAENARLWRIAEVRADQVAVLSHEVRTPLAIIKAAADLLLDESPGPVTPQQHTFLETISQNCERTITLAEDLLVQARIDAGLFRVRLEPVDLRALLRQVSRGIRPLIAAQDQSVTIHAPQIVPRVHADPRLIQQVLTNLLQNASRYTSRGGHIYISLAENDRVLSVAVTDDGAGMSRQERSHLFQKFVSGRPVGDGTGLGLVISKQIVEHHGGRILVDTGLGQGTTFLFTLPILESEPAPREQAHYG